MPTVVINPNLHIAVRKRALAIGERIGVYVETAIEMRLNDKLKSVEDRKQKRKS